MRKIRASSRGGEGGAGMSEERVFVSFEQAVAMLPDKEYIHTFRNGGIALLGAAWSKAEIIEQLRDHKNELAGGCASSMGHGLYSADEYGGVFIETKPASSEPKEEGNNKI